MNILQKKKKKKKEYKMPPNRASSMVSFCMAWNGILYYTVYLRFFSQNRYKFRDILIVYSFYISYIKPFI